MSRGAGASPGPAWAWFYEWTWLTVPPDRLAPADGKSEWRPGLLRQQQRQRQPQQGRQVRVPLRSRRARFDFPLLQTSPHDTLSSLARMCVFRVVRLPSVGKRYAVAAAAATSNFSTALRNAWLSIPFPPRCVSRLASGFRTTYSLNGPV